MDRLTNRIAVPERENDLIVFTKGKYDDTIPAEMTHDDIRAVLRRLAEYEDLEERGLLLRLPCPIGTTVYNTTCWDDVTEKVEVDGKTIYKIVHKHKVSKSTFSLGDIYNFGKTVFLTKSEAEQKLKEMESD